MGDHAVTTRRESARLAEGMRRLEWMLRGVCDAGHELYEGMTPAALHHFDGQLEDLIEEAGKLRVLVGRTWDQVSARSEAAA
jgi:hypothetical protein